ncbi:MAG TPA: leucyl aminopeptidase family protein [Fimbriimonadaceae bacterium]|nr:leucyl aminopeptidase family protein [Fimbriimonadaceae bacterium]
MFSSVRTSKPGRTSIPVVFSSKGVPKGSSKALVSASKRAGFKFGAGEVSESFGPGGHAIVVGIGSGSAEDWRTAASALARHTAASGTRDLALRGDTLGAGEACLVGEAFGLLGWDAVLYRGKGGSARGAKPVRLQSADRDVLEGLKKGLALAECTNLTRSLVQTPPNIATPEMIAETAQALAKESGMKCTVFKGKRLEEEHLAGLMNVGKASVNAPCMVRLEYAPPGTEKDAPFVLLGKTITYDTGGLSLKDRTNMRGMKVDKAGGCAVIGAMAAIAKVLKPNKRIVGLMVAAENSVSDVSYRPDDVLTFRNGVTVEVTNTDAEGRLVLADGLCWACDAEKARCIVDIATLTGGVVRALGNVYAGVFSNDDDLCWSLVTTALATDEMLWRLPLHPRYDAMMKSQVADIVNSNMSGMAHPVQGAVFLQNFVKKSVPWAHIDMAGHGTVDKDSNALVPGPTGFGVRLLSEFASNY